MLFFCVPNVLATNVCQHQTATLLNQNNTSSLIVLTGKTYFISGFFFSFFSLSFSFEKYSCSDVALFSVCFSDLMTVRELAELATTNPSLIEALIEKFIDTDGEYRYLSKGFSLRLFFPRFG